MASAAPALTQTLDDDLPAVARCIGEMDAYADAAEVYHPPSGPMTRDMAALSMDALIALRPSETRLPDWRAEGRKAWENRAAALQRTPRPPGAEQAHHDAAILCQTVMNRLRDAGHMP